VNAPRFDGGSTGKSVDGARFDVPGTDPSFRQPALPISQRTLEQTLERTPRLPSQMWACNV
jgi:hypothetical protein